MLRLFLPTGAAVLVPSTTATATVCILYAILYLTAAIQDRVDAVRVLLYEYSGTRTAASCTRTAVLICEK